MLDTYIQIFYAVMAQLTTLIVPVFGFWLVISLISSLFFKDR